MINRIICGNSLEEMKNIPDNTVHLIVTSPPYNVGIDYDNYEDLLPHDDYLKWTKQIWAECKRVLVSGGRICINIDATTNLDESDNALLERVHPLHVDFTNQLRELGFIYRAEIIWSKQNCSGNKTCWGSYCSPSNPHIRRNCEYIIVASKDDLKLVGDPEKIDITKDEFHLWTLSEWKINPETNKHSIHPATFPKELARRCIKLFSYVENVILDPFNGTGSTTTSAIELGRQYIGIDLSSKYCSKAKSDASLAKQKNKLYGYKFTPPSKIVKEESKLRQNTI